MPIIEENELFFSCTSPQPQASCFESSANMPGPPSPDELSQREPLVSLHRAREFISEHDILEILDSVIVLVMKRMIKTEKANRVEQPDAATDLTDSFIREYLESPVILSVEELAALLKRQSVQRKRPESEG